MLRIQTPSLLVEDALSQSPVSNDDVKIALELSGVQRGVGEYMYYAPDDLSPELGSLVLPMRHQVASVLDDMGFHVFLAPQRRNKASKDGVWQAVSDPSIVFKHTKGFAPHRFDVPQHPHLTPERIFPLRDTDGRLLHEALSLAPSMHGVPTLSQMHLVLPLPLRLRALLDAMKGSHSALSPVGIKHGDVKPDNIFITPHPKNEIAGQLFDFEGVSHISSPVFPVFSPLYTPSTYFGHHVSRLALSSDIFSYGISLLEVLTSDDIVVAFYKAWEKRRGVIEKFAPDTTPSSKMLELYSRGFGHLLHDFCERNRISGPIEKIIFQMLDPRAESIPPSLNSVVRVIEREYRLP